MAGRCNHAVRLTFTRVHTHAHTRTHTHTQARNAIESLQADLEFARIQATEIQRAGPSLQEVAERERVVGELKQTIRSYESRERSSHLKMESMRAQVRRNCRQRAAASGMCMCVYAAMRLCVWM